jgi:hypothetical protein
MSSSWSLAKRTSPCTLSCTMVSPVCGALSGRPAARPAGASAGRGRASARHSGWACPRRAALARISSSSSGEWRSSDRPCPRRAAARRPRGGGRRARTGRRSRRPNRAPAISARRGSPRPPGGRALAVGVLDAQQELAAGVAGVEPVEQRRARAADMQEAGGRGGKRVTSEGDARSPDRRP